MNLKKIIAGAFATDDPKYRTASPVSMLFCSAGSGAKQAMYILMMYASYMANVGFGVAVTVTGVILTVKGVFDGAIDPFLAAIYDRMPVRKFGKMRFFMIIGWILCSIAALAMFFVLPNKFSGVPGVVVFVIVYFLFVIGYSTMGIGVTTVPAILTNNPKQRPFLSFTATCYQYLVPMVITTILSFSILPKHNNQYDAACLSEAVWIFLAISAVLVFLACIGMAKVDTPEVLGELVTNGGTKEEKIGLRDMWNFVVKNKPMRAYLVTGITDKIANNALSQSTITTLVNGVLIGSYTATTLIGNAGMIIGMISGFFGGAVIAKFGTKKAVSVFSWLSIFLAGGMTVFMLILGPANMKSIAAAGIPLIIYVVLSMVKRVVTMMLNVGEGMMRADIVDYELERSGNYMPGMVGAIYTFTEQIIASFGATIAAFAIAAIGYVNTVPQMGDEATWAVLWVVILLTEALPALGWLCNIVAMKFYPLDKERMEEVQKNIYERKIAAKKAAGK